MPNTQSTATMPERQHATKQQHQQIDVAQDVVEYLKHYAREKPEVVALWCFGLGFILGWKLKPW